MGMMGGESRGHGPQAENPDEEERAEVPPTGLIESCRRTYEELVRAKSEADGAGKAFQGTKELYDRLEDALRNAPEDSAERRDLEREIERLRTTIDSLIDTFEAALRKANGIREEMDALEEHTSLVNAPGSSEGRAEKRESLN